MKMRLLALALVVGGLLAGIAFSLEHAVGDPWGSGTSTITRFLGPRTTWWYVSVVPSTQNAVMIYYKYDTPVDTFTILAGDAWNTPAALEMNKYEIVRAVATDGIDYATRKDGR